MVLQLVRKHKKENYTIGQLFIDEKLFCNTLEDKDRGLSSSMTEDIIKLTKVPSKTAIPTGIYNIDMDTVSPKYSKYSFYREVCKGKVPRLQNVKGFEGILIHSGNTHEDSSGCILVGNNSVQGKVTNSKETFKKLYDVLFNAHQKGDKITIKID